MLRAHIPIAERQPVHDALPLEIYRSMARRVERTHQQPRPALTLNRTACSNRKGSQQR